MTKLKSHILIGLILLAFCNSLYSQNWELQKERDNLKAYTANKTNSDVKQYKVIATINVPISCVYSTLTDYDNYSEMIKEISKYEVLSKNDTVVKTYSLIDLPWPFDDRDIVAITYINRTPNTIYLTSKAINDTKVKKNNNVIRLDNFSEKYIIEAENSNQTKIQIIGHVDIGGSIPAWLQNMLVVDGSINIIDYINEKCQNSQ